MTPRRANKKHSAHELARFLALLTQTHNFALSCDRLGRARSGLYKRRKRDPAFAAQCRAAIALFHSSPSLPGGGGPPKVVEGPPAPLILTSYARMPQLRRARPDSLTPAKLRAFLVALAASANIRLSAGRAGAAHSSFYALCRRDPRFEETLRDALAEGYESLEANMVRTACDWLRAELDGAGTRAQPPIPGMTAELALRLLAHHRNTVRLDGMLADRRRKNEIEAVRARIERTMRALGLIKADDAPPEGAPENTPD